MKFSFLSSHTHFTDWLLPLWRALPDETRGTFYAKGQGYSRAQQVGLEPEHRRIQGDDVMVVASWQDYMGSRHRRVVFVNHGVGQTYTGDPRTERNPAYSGGANRDRTVLFLEPNEHSAVRSREAYPRARVEVVGPFKLDDWLNGTRQRVAGVAPKVVVSFHADVQICPETRSSFRHYQYAVRELVESGRYEIRGHWHPRSKPTMKRWWAKLGVEAYEHFEEVLDNASVFVTDNSSTLFEAAAIGIPVVVLDAPWYRRDVTHGLRFWEAADIGVRIDEPEELSSAIGAALDDHPVTRFRREALVEYVYSGVADGQATERAVEAMLRLEASE